MPPQKKNPRTAPVWAWFKVHIVCTATRYINLAPLHPINSQHFFFGGGVSHTGIVPLWFLLYH